MARLPARQELEGPMSMKSTLSLFWLVLAALLYVPADAQVLYKSTMPDGKVVFGDKPAPGAAKVESIKPDVSKQGVVPPSKGEADTLKKLEDARLKRETSQDKIEAAEKRLRDAEAAKAAGVEPRAGERQGTVSGKQRFTGAYWERQKQLDRDVEDARKALERARAGK
jgi:hypothetical protein